MRSRTYLLHAVCIAVGLTVFADRAQSEDIVLGMSAAFSGPTRALGIECYRGASAFFEDLNSRGGIHGRKVVIRAYDDGYNPVPALVNTERLLQDKDVL